MRLVSIRLAVACALVAASSSLQAQESLQPPPATAAPDASPPTSAAPVPVAPPPPLAPAPRTPDQLLDKSVKDLAHGSIRAAVKDDVKALRRGPLLIHGNYCGIGNRPGTEPTDPLDAACMRHDACTKTGGMPNCACDGRLQAEATAIAQDPSEPPDLRALATATAASMAVLICK